MRQSHICMQINREEQLGSKTMQPRVPAQGNKPSKILAVKSYRNSDPHRRVCWRDPQGPRMYTSPPTQESTTGGPNLLVGGGEVTES